MKTKPIGVRFDEDLLEVLKEDKIANSPQKVLNFLTDFYREKRNKPMVEAIKNSKLFKPKEAIKSNLIDRHRLWKEDDPSENSFSFLRKYDCMNYAELEAKQNS